MLRMRVLEYNLRPHSVSHAFTSRLAAGPPLTMERGNHLESLMSIIPSLYWQWWDMNKLLGAEISQEVGK